MIVLLDVAGISVTAAAVLCVWLARRLWLYWQPAPQRATVTVTIIRPIPSPRPGPERPAPAILEGRIIEPPRRTPDPGLARRAPRQK